MNVIIKFSPIKCGQVLVQNWEKKLVEDCMIISTSTFLLEKVFQMHRKKKNFRHRKINTFIEVRSESKIK